MVKYLLPLLLACSCWGQSFTLLDSSFTGNIARSPGPPFPLTNFIRSYWPMTEGTGTTVNDQATSDGADIIPPGWTAPARLPLYLGDAGMWGPGNGYSVQRSLNCGNLAATIYSYTNNDLNLCFIPAWTLCMWVCHTNSQWSTSQGNTWMSGITWPPPLVTVPDFRWFMRNGISPYFQEWHPAAQTLAGVIDGGFTTTLFPNDTWVWLGLSRSNSVYTFFTNGVTAKIVDHGAGIVVGQQSFPQRFQFGGETFAGDVARWQGRIGEIIYYYGTNLNATDMSYIYHRVYGMP